MAAKVKPNKTAAKGFRVKAGAKKGEAYVCGVCGYRLVVDRACGCAAVHTHYCCSQKMAKVAAKK
jgi:hypothetical protein